ncbi:hypothetical protein BDV96DRAFT_594081 [Lophiotrema nucula]|uniref:Uncharacterized protein n=1 Tax=Lophiotrema nucula TaxID=690887 RepID=A0A6A5ZRQ2_9PLEO|nr:hypothetical protein BDV96DRAFT_594081 [Lophiotrema nucula]
MPPLRQNAREADALLTQHAYRQDPSDPSNVRASPTTDTNGSLTPFTLRQGQSAGQLNPPQGRFAQSSMQMMGSELPYPHGRHTHNDGIGGGPQAPGFMHNPRAQQLLFAAQQELAQMRAHRAQSSPHQQVAQRNSTQQLTGEVLDATNLATFEVSPAITSSKLQHPRGSGFDDPFSLYPPSIGAAQSYTPHLHGYLGEGQIALPDLDEVEDNASPSAIGGDSPKVAGDSNDSNEPGRGYGKLFKNQPGREAAWDLPNPSALNCTMVEIIVLLPRIYQNFPIAIRFVNNGLDQSLHRFILCRHKWMPEDNRTLGWSAILSQDDKNMNPNTLCRGYENCIRKGAAKNDKYGHPSHELGKLQFYKGWVRRQHHMKYKLKDWDAKYADDVDLSNYSNTATKAPARSISFAALAQGVNKLPEGDDAGDLTKALRFILDNPATCSQYKFPDDIHTVLGRAGGGATFTAGMRDRAIVARYSEMKNAAEKAAGNRGKASRGPRVPKPQKPTAGDDQPAVEDVVGKRPTLASATAGPKYLNEQYQLDDTLEPDASDEEWAPDNGNQQEEDEDLEERPRKKQKRSAPAQRAAFRSSAARPTASHVSSQRNHAHQAQNQPSVARGARSGQEPARNLQGQEPGRKSVLEQVEDAARQAGFRGLLNMSRTEAAAHGFYLSDDVYRQFEDDDSRCTMLTSTPVQFAVASSITSRSKSEASSGVPDQIALILDKSTIAISRYNCKNCMRHDQPRAFLSSHLSKMSTYPGLQYWWTPPHTPIPDQVLVKYNENFRRQIFRRTHYSNPWLGYQYGYNAYPPNVACQDPRGSYVHNTRQYPTPPPASPHELRSYHHGHYQAGTTLRYFLGRDGIREPSKEESIMNDWASEWHDNSNEQETTSSPYFSNELELQYSLLRAPASIDLSSRQGGPMLHPVLEFECGQSDQNNPTQGHVVQLLRMNEEPEGSLMWASSELLLDELEDQGFRMERWLEWHPDFVCARAEEEGRDCKEKSANWVGELEKLRIRSNSEEGVVVSAQGVSKDFPFVLD